MVEKTNSNTNHMLTKLYTAEGDFFLILGIYSGGSYNRDGIPSKSSRCDDSDQTIL